MLSLCELIKSQADHMQRLPSVPCANRENRLLLRDMGYDRSSKEMIASIHECYILYAYIKHACTRMYAHMLVRIAIHMYYI